MSTVAAPEIPNMPVGNATSEEPLESAKAAGAIDGKIAIVTGASRGIGRAIALRLARNSAKILLVARNEGALASVAEEISSVGGTPKAWAADLREARLRLRPFRRRSKHLERWTLS